MSKEKHNSSEEEAVAPKTEVEPASGELTEDELSEAVGGAGAEEDSPQSTDDGSRRSWWHDPNS